jgi:hypothetical protein
MQELWLLKTKQDESDWKEQYSDNHLSENDLCR